MLPLSDLVKERILTRKTTPQGLHILQGVTLFAGVLPYPVQNDGVVTVSGVLSHPEDLFNNSLTTLVGVGVYLEHPQSGFTYDLKDAVGIVLSAEPRQNYSSNSEEVSPIQGVVEYAFLKVGIWDDTALETINNGKKELSAGYDATLVAESGIWYGTPYSYRKKNIVYNHLAIVDNGTARNGAYSRLIDKQNGEYTHIYETDARIVDFLSLNIIKDSDDSDFIPIEQIIGGTPMKHLAIGKNVISVEDTSATALAEFIDAATATENKLKVIEAEKSNLEQEIKSLKLKIKDSEDTLAKLQSVPANSSLPIEELKKAMTIVKRAEELGVQVDFDNFSTEAIIKQALESKGLPTNATIETLEYAFNNIIIPSDAPPKTIEPAVEVATPQSIVTDSKNTNLLSSAVKASASNFIESSEEFADAMAKKRKANVKRPAV